MLANAMKGPPARFDPISYSAADKEELLKTAQTAPFGVQAYMTVTVAGDKFRRIFTRWEEGWRDDYGEYHAAESAFGALVEAMLKSGADFRVDFA